MYIFFYLGGKVFESSLFVSVINYQNEVFCETFTFIFLAEILYILMDNPNLEYTSFISRTF